MKNIEKIINEQLTKSGIENDDIAAWQHQQDTEIIARFGVNISPMLIDKINYIWHETYCKNNTSAARETEADFRNGRKHYEQCEVFPNDEQIKVILCTKNNNLGG